LVRDVHRKEKIAKATSAAIAVEQIAASQLDQSSSAEDALSVYAETDAARFQGNAVYIIGNPLKTTTDILCPKCKLPRLLHPTDGNGAQKPKPGVVYCKKRPYIDKLYYDIYGQTFDAEGPGKGKKKADVVHLKQKAKESTPNGSQESTGDDPFGEEIGPIKFPHAKCEACSRFFPIRRMNNHMARCIGGVGRESSRNAQVKIQNGNGNGSQNGFTPPTSRSNTPIPTNGTKRSSPTKRGTSQDFDFEESPQKKKKIKNNILKLKAPKMAKSASQHSTSNLSFSERPPGSDEEMDDGGDDDRDGTWGGNSISVETKKNTKLKIKKPIKPPKPVTMTIGNHKKPPPRPDSPTSLPPEVSKVTKLKIEINRKNGVRDESESSQTLSSPN
jgi:hypothetical protein